MRWHFTPKTPGERTRDPISGEFFASDAIRNAGEALLREAIQNSLDARVNRRGTTRVRVFLSENEAALEPGRHLHWFSSAWPHWTAKRNGLRPERLLPLSPCRFLVLEDFGTTGLVGDQRQHDEQPGNRNPFFYFFRAEGATEKEGETLGRWGIGKQVFPRSSTAQSFIAYSVTEENPEGFLMGSCILKHHRVDGVTYRPDGYFAEVEELPSGGRLAVPSFEISEIERFRQDFGLTRQSGQCGLSVVVPWIDDEPAEASGLDLTGIVMAVVEHYFVPIIEEKLEVQVDTPHSSIRINGAHFDRSLQFLRQNTPNEHVARVERIARLSALARAARRSETPRVQLQDCPEIKATWNDSTLSESAALSIRESLAAVGQVEVRVGLWVRSKERGAVRDELVCHLMKVDDANDRACHLREDLLISGVRSPRINGYVAIVRAPEGPLATLLGDSENPAHTEWSACSRNFKDKYTYGGLCIDFVTNFASELLRRVFSSSKQLDRQLLARYFSDPGVSPSASREPSNEDEADSVGSETVPAGAVAESTAPDPNLPASPPRMRIEPTEDGFSLLLAGAPSKIGAEYVVEAAYATSKGDAFRKHQRFDFSFQERGEVSVASSGCEIAEPTHNSMRIRITDGDFAFRASGFDTNRDLRVRVRVVKGSADEHVTESQLETEGGGEEITVQP